MPNINIDDAYILGETGAQVDKVTGLFTKNENATTGEKQMARLNIAAGGSNRNLLDNPWWGSGEVVNQRAVTTKPTTNGSYTIDRWKLSSGADANQWAIGANGATFTIASSSIWYMQIIPNISSLFGKTLTASVMFGDGTIKSRTATLTSSASATFWGDTQSNVSLNTNGTFQITVRATQTIRAVKLELGSVSTLANDAPPDYAEELAKCQRYFLRISQSTSNAPMGFGVATSPTSALVTIPIPVTMRSGGTITVTATGATTLRFGSSNVTVTSIAFRNIAPNAIAITANVASGLSGNNAVMFMPDAGYILNISADL